QREAHVNRCMCAWLSVVLFVVVVVPSGAVTYFVPRDRDLVIEAVGIVYAPGIGSYSHFPPDGRLVPTACLQIDNVLKGPFAPSDTLELTELGGEVGDVGLFVAGAPRYAAGEQYLIFVGQNAHGEYSTWGMGLGRFAVVTDVRGRRILDRGIEGDG